MSLLHPSVAVHSHGHREVALPSRPNRWCDLKAIDKAVRKAIKSGISGGLIDQTVATSIHAANVKAARKVAAPKKEVVKAERVVSAKRAAKAAKRTAQEVD